MEEDQAYVFGNVALSYFRPKILIVSTPNHEYNVILQKSTLSTPEDDLDERVNHNLVSFVTMTTSLSGREHSSIAGQLNWPQGTTTALSSVGLVDLVMNQVLLPRLLSLDGEPYLRKIILKNSQIRNIITKLYGNGVVTIDQYLLCKRLRHPCSISDPMKVSFYLGCCPFMIIV